MDVWVLISTCFLDHTPGLNNLLGFFGMTDTKWPVFKLQHVRVTRDGKEKSPSLMSQVMFSSFLSFSIALFLVSSYHVLINLSA